MRTFDIALVGTGGIAGIHADQVGKLNGRARIVAVAEVDQVRREKFAAKWDVARQYQDLPQLLDGESPDLVVLCTPPALHHEQALMCLANSRHVLCEKPPALSLAQLDSLAAAEVSGKGRFITVSQHRFGSGALSLRRLVGDPRLGAPMTAVCHTLWYRPDDYFDVPWRGSWESEGGGPTLGHGIHQMDLLLSILGDWQEVAAVAARRARPTQTEDLSCAVVTLANGAVVSVVNSLVSPLETTYLRFDFAHATVELRHLYGYGDKDWNVTPLKGHETPVLSAWAEGPQGVPSGHASQFRAVFDAIEAGTPPPVQTSDARRTLELITAIYASALTGRPVRAGEIGAGSPFYHSMDGGIGVAPAARFG